MIKFNKNLIIAILLVTILILGAVSFTFSWFKDYSINKGVVNTISVTAGDMLQVSVDGGKTFSSSFNLSYDDLVLKDITGNGITFIVPEKTLGFNVTEHGVEYENIYSAGIEADADYLTAVSSKDDSTSEKSYISLDIKFRSNKKLVIYLGSESYVKPAFKTSEETADSDVIQNKSAYGNLSRDYIAGAARVSFVTTSGTGTKNVSLYWIPNSAYELSFEEVTQTVDEKEVTGNQWVIREEGIPEDEIEDEDQSGYFYYSYDNLQKALVKNTVSNYVKDLPTLLPSTVDPSAENAVIDLTWDSTDKLYYGSVTLNIWIEGTDREARRALAGGNISAYFKFIGIESVE